MNDCLNCGKKVKNKFCDLNCQNQYKKKKSIEEYNKHLKKCLFCGFKIEYDRRINKFCSSSYNNSKIKNRSILSKVSDENLIEFFKTSNTYNEFYYKIGYNKRPTSNIIKEKLFLFGLDFDSFKRKKVLHKTKYELFSGSLNWQSARSTISQYARDEYSISDKPKCCYVCGYDKHIEIAHIKSVSSFDDSVLISEINHKDNLVALCPNHHWEFDNGILKI